MDLSRGLIQGVKRQALENLPALAEDDTTQCLLPKAIPYPPNYISVSHFSIKSRSLAQTCLQRAEITCLDFVSKQRRSRQVLLSVPCLWEVTSSTETSRGGGGGRGLMPSSTTEGRAAHLHFLPGYLHLQEQDIPHVALPQIR